MVSRKAGKDGRRFWGCAAFPGCRGTRDTDGLSPAERRLTPRGVDDEGAPLTERWRDE
jgi:ssDNA-binding Zn-finger/Zn-ribbon topoisomerase 1